MAEINQSGVTAAEALRFEMLLRMYDQMFNDIDRHILVVWQSVGVLIGAFAVFALTEKNVISIDVATSLIVLLSGWLMAHLNDASYWYNRNLVIIANIERQFLSRQDLRNIHYYFGRHRPKNKMISHLRIQFAMALGLTGLIVLMHLFTRVLPGFRLSWHESVIDWQRALPYAMLAITLAVVAVLREEDNLAYSEFITNSPGIFVDTTGIDYGVGHGFGSVVKNVASSWLRQLRS
jgi:hypothetical protein